MALAGRLDEARLEMVVVVVAVRLPQEVGCRLVVVRLPHRRCRHVESVVLVYRRCVVVFVLVNPPVLCRPGPHRPPEVPECRSRRPHWRCMQQRLECDYLQVLLPWVSAVDGYETVSP